MSKGKGKNRTVFPISKPKGTSRKRFNNKSTKQKSRFKVPTLPNDPPRDPTVDELTPSEQKKTLEILNLLDKSGSGLDKQGKELKKELERKRKISTLPNDPPKSDLDTVPKRESLADFRLLESHNGTAMNGWEWDPLSPVSSGTLQRWVGICW